LWWVKIASLAHLFLVIMNKEIRALKGELAATKAREEELERAFLQSTIKWKDLTDTLVLSYQEIFEDAVIRGDVNSLREAVRGYRELLLQSFRDFSSQIDSGSNEEGLTPLMAIAAFRPLYVLLELDREQAFSNPLFGRMLAGLEKGRGHRLYDKTCREFQQALGEKISKGPCLPYDPSNQVLLQLYTGLHQKMKRICRGHKGLKAREKVSREYPEIESIYQQDFTHLNDRPSEYALNVLARWRRRNYWDLKHELAAERKIEQALKAVGIDYAPDIGFDALECFARALTLFRERQEKTSLQQCPETEQAQSGSPSENP